MNWLDGVGLAPRLHRWSPYSIEEVFDASYIPEPNSGCWIWLGAAYFTAERATALRPCLRYRGVRKYAYQFSYERFIGEIPDGKQICHRCNTSLCVNPDHLYAGTSLENNRDAVAIGTHFSVALRRRAIERAATEGRVHKPRNRDNKVQYENRKKRRS